MSDVDNNVIALMVLQEENKQLKIKLDKIGQIIKDHDNDSMPEDYWYIDKIREVLNNESNN